MQARLLKLMLSCAKVVNEDPMYAWCCISISLAKLFAAVSPSKCKTFLVGLERKSNQSIFAHSCWYCIFSDWNYKACSCFRPVWLYGADKNVVDRQIIGCGWNVSYFLEIPIKESIGWRSQARQHLWRQLYWIFDKGIQKNCGNRFETLSLRFF